MASSSACTPQTRKKDWKNLLTETISSCADGSMCLSNLATWLVASQAVIDNLCI